MKGARKVFLFLFFTVYAVCNLALIGLPLVTSYICGNSRMPSIIAMAVGDEQGVLKAFLENFEGVISFAATSTAFWKAIGGFICFAMTIASPVFVILSFIPFVKNLKYTLRGVKYSEDKVCLNITREAFCHQYLSVRRLFWSQSVHIFYLLCGLKEQQFGTLRLGLYITMAVCFIFISELH